MKPIVARIQHYCSGCKWVIPVGVNYFKSNGLEICDDCNNGTDSTDQIFSEREVKTLANKYGFQFRVMRANKKRDEAYFKVVEPNGKEHRVSNTFEAYNKISSILNL